MIKINDFAFTENGLQFCVIKDCLNEDIMVHESTDLKDPRVCVFVGDEVILLNQKTSQNLSRAIKLAFKYHKAHENKVSRKLRMTAFYSQRKVKSK